jgi:hypothetical protein
MKKLIEQFNKNAVFMHTDQVNENIKFFDIYDIKDFGMNFFNSNYKIFNKEVALEIIFYVSKLNDIELNFEINKLINEGILKHFLWGGENTYKIAI